MREKNGFYFLSFPVQKRFRYNCTITIIITHRCEITATLKSLREEENKNRFIYEF